MTRLTLLFSFNPPMTRSILPGWRESWQHRPRRARVCGVSQLQLRGDVRLGLHPATWLQDCAGQETLRLDDWRPVPQLAGRFLCPLGTADLFWPGESSALFGLAWRWVFKWIGVRDLYFGVFEWWFSGFRVLESSSSAFPLHGGGFVSCKICRRGSDMRFFYQYTEFHQLRSGKGDSGEVNCTRLCFEYVQAASFKRHYITLTCSEAMFCMTKCSSISLARTSICILSSGADFVPSQRLPQLKVKLDPKQEGSNERLFILNHFWYFEADILFSGFWK